MLFHPPKNPVELRVSHLNEAQEQRREDINGSDPRQGCA